MGWTGFQPHPLPVNRAVRSDVTLDIQNPKPMIRTLFTLGLATIALHVGAQEFAHTFGSTKACLLYTSDAADE